MNKEKIIKAGIVTLVTIVTIYILFRFGKAIYYKLVSRNNAKKLENSIIASELSYDNAQYEAFANSLYNAMEGLGTDEEAIQNIFNQMNSRSDVLKLIAVFGVKDEMTLNEWLDDDLSSSDKDEYVNKVLESKSIEYVF